MRGLWSRVALVIGLKLGRALVLLGLKLAKLGDQLGTRTFVHVQRLAQGQQRKREPDTHDQNDTPDKRHPTRCTSCGMLEIEGHSPDCPNI
jgi:hypothetical protein